MKNEHKVHALLDELKKNLEIKLENFKIVGQCKC